MSRQTLAVVLVAALAGPAASQSMDVGYGADNPSVGFTPPSYPPTPHSAPMHHASTYPEGLARGVAAVMKAYADGVLSLAQARILIAEAEAREMRNRVINTQTFAERKQTLERHRQWTRDQKALKRERGLAKQEERRATRYYAAYRLPPTRLDRRVGTIRWPAVFDRPDYRAEVEEVTACFEELAFNGPQYDRILRDTIEAHCESLAAKLERDRERLGWECYLAAKKFVLGLHYEAEYWPEKAGAEQDARRVAGL